MHESLFYCRRPYTIIDLFRDNNTASCKNNDGISHLMSHMRTDQVNISTVLHTWRSGLEQVEKYSRYLRDPPHHHSDGYLCQCTHPQAFGKNCEYQLPIGTTFDETLRWQFEKKPPTPWDVQRYGNITCYETLKCDFGLLCLDWREICDGVQHCMYGYDEEDENLTECRQWWVCPENLIQCRTGECIQKRWIDDEEWDCIDGSDDHQALNNMIDYIRKKKSKPSPDNELELLFSRCNRTHPFPCLALNLSRENSCISLDRIGNDEIDCAGAIDERNTLQHCDHTLMLGSDFQCLSTNTCIPYLFHCRHKKRCPNPIDDHHWCSRQHQLSADCVTAQDFAVEKLQIFSHEPAHQLTQVYGFIKSSENIRDATTPLPQYIRLSLDTGAETVVKFMYKGWNLPKPDMIISVTGGAKNYDMSAQLRKIFQMRLVSTASRANAWLITAGTNIGVAKEVGEAVNYCRYNNRKHGLDVPCIGIASWGYTAGNKQLDNQSTHSLMNTSDTTTIRSPSKPSQNQRAQIVPMDNKDRYIREYIVKENQPRECYLEPNHTHFLLFDNGQRKADTIHSLQAEIGKYSRNTHLANTADETVKSLIPIVMVLVDGGSSSIRAICEALKCGTPVVVIKHSGRAADLVAALHACYSDHEIDNDGITSTHSTKSQTDIVKGGSKEQMIEEILTFAKEQYDIRSIDDVKNDLCRTLDLYKHLVTIFEFDGTRHRGNLEAAFLESLSNARKSSHGSNEQHSLAKELKLAIAWHKFSYVQTCLRTDTRISKLKQDDLRPVLVEALYHGHTDCVKLLIEFGTSLEKLTHADLEELYMKSANHQLSSKDMSMKDQYYLDCFAPIVNSMNKINNLSQFNHNAPLGETAPEDLFLWAVFFDRFELAIYLCSKIWNISLALLCGAYIYRRAASEANHTDIKQRYEEHADRFDTGAASIINLCFDDDEQFALDLLRRSAVAFKHITPLDLVKDAECKSFLASKCVQRHLDNIWYGHINYKRKAINFKIFVCSLFFPLLPIFCFCLNYIKKSKNNALNTQDGSTAIQLTTTNKRKNNVSYVDRIIYFYNAPIVRFYYHTIFFIVFLGLFSFVLLVDYFPLNIYNDRRSGFKNLQIPITEIILHICIWSLIVEEIYQILSVKLIKQYISDKWNMIDIIAIILYLIGFITRFVVLETVFAISKKVFSLYNIFSFEL
ncbi:unnamed protein product [Rotaria sordida]|uniref:Transient receptor potential cation channel subfamily M member 2 n=1 Tax=Rotaria sordida TaxID=392033 RepID=A0A814PMD6_9BILA|nr:unnamed protein product [Rotaria sordida]